MLLFVSALDRDAFRKGLPDEAECERRLENLRWPEGFRCPRCGHDHGERCQRRAVECTKCGAQASLTAGTFLERTRVPLARWFGAMAWLAEHPDGRPGELAKAVGVSRPTARRWVSALWATRRTSQTVLLGEVSVTCWRLVPTPAAAAGKPAPRPLYLLAAVERGGDGQMRMELSRDSSTKSACSFIRHAMKYGSALDVTRVEWKDELQAAGYRVRVSPWTEDPPAEWKDATQMVDAYVGDLDGRLFSLARTPRSTRPGVNWTPSFACGIPEGEAASPSS